MMQNLYTSIFHRNSCLHFFGNMLRNRLWKIGPLAHHLTVLKTWTCRKTGSETRKNSPDPVVKPLKWQVTRITLTKMYYFLTSMCLRYKQTQFDLCNWYIGWVIDEKSIYSVFFLPHGVSERKNGARYFFSADIFNFFAFLCYLDIYPPNTVCQSRIREHDLV